jgi:hypothetical protein
MKQARNEMIEKLLNQVELARVEGDEPIIEIVAKEGNIEVKKRVVKCWDYTRTTTSVFIDGILKAWDGNIHYDTSKRM